MNISLDKKGILEKDFLKIIFVGKLSLNIGSDRVFIKTFSKFLSSCKNCIVEITDEITDKKDCDVAIFKKGYSLRKLKSIVDKNPNFKIGIINPSDKKNEKIKLKLANFAIVGSVEEKAYYSKYLKCFIYPLIEDISPKLIRNYDFRPEKVVCYHGNKQHLDFLNINIERALLKLVKNGYEFKAIYNFKELGKCNKRFITKHIQWDKDNFLEEIADSSVGICPYTHYTGFIRNAIAKSIISKKEISNDYLLQFKNTSNASRAFVFHQLKIPVVAEIGGSHHHILGDETAGYLCYSENSWYESIKSLCNDKNLNKSVAEKAYFLMNKLYDPLNWSQRFLNDLRTYLNEG
tara:strand:- start:480 stop:1523 length:1044 start_codon:yes stop_codon:yes gene_type:complete